MDYVKPISRLINALSKLPGVGGKTAARLTLFLLNARKEVADEIINALKAVKEEVTLCETCMNFSEASECEICSSSQRDKGLICVVGDYKDMIAIENTGIYTGTYHILHGALAPLKGMGPDDIRIKELINRVEKDNIEEIILANAFDAEGETTASYINELLMPFNVKISRIASGVPFGSYIEYMDVVTLERAMAHRQKAD